MYDRALILAPIDDVHAQLVQRALNSRRVPCDILSASDFTTESFCSRIEVDDSPQLRWQGRDIGPETVVWWRRVTTPPGDARVWDQEILNFVRQERKHSLHGALFAAGCRIKNEPEKQSRANHKPLQLEVARRNGLSIPRTCITNDLDVARAFYAELADEGKRCIYKPFGPCRYHVAETRVLEAFDLDQEELALTPVCFQECIERGLDLRVNVIGDEVYAAAVKPNFDDLVDWRLDGSARFEEYPLEDDLEESLRRTRRSLGLDWGAFDLRLDPEGEPYFFEVNPSGQFLFVESETGTPLVSQFAEMLISEA